MESVAGGRLQVTEELLRRSNWRRVGLMLPLLLFGMVIPRSSAADARVAKVEVCRNQTVQKDYLGVPVDICGRQWIVYNLATVVEFWEVHELEFYWDESCQVKLGATAPLSWEVMTHPNWRDNTADKAMDGDLNSRYTANCRYLVGGCLPRQAYVGVDIAGYPKLAIHHTDTDAKVRCIRIWQSPNLTRQAMSIQLAVSQNLSSQGAINFALLDKYEDLSGGHWYKRPATNQQLWRLWNKDPTANPWEVAEIIFYTDQFCSVRADGVGITGGSLLSADCVLRQDCDEFSPHNAFDGVTRRAFPLPDPLPTKWVADCSRFDGCKAEEAWIGIDFGMDPKTVNCFRIYQMTHEGYPFWGSPVYSQGLLLDAWDGYMWTPMQIVDGMYHGGWNSTMPKPNYAWRLANFDKTKGAWQVMELEFYEESYCGVMGLVGIDPTVKPLLKVIGTAVDSNPTMPVTMREQACKSIISGCSDLAMDGLVGTAWQSDCVTCGQRQAWVGVRAIKEIPQVNCFRLFQGGAREHQTDAVELSRWDGEEWIVVRKETSSGGGTWNYRPADPYFQWRLIATGMTVKPWTVVGLAFYADANCNDEYTPDRANPIASGSVLNQEPQLAFDASNATEWTATSSAPAIGAAGCAPSSAWIGLEAHTQAMNVKCIRLYQHRDRLRQTAFAALQRWDGSKWITPKDSTYPELGGGSWQSLPGVRGSMWRFFAEKAPSVNGPGVGVGVAELKFYRSTTCDSNSEVKAQVPNLVPITSGYASGKEVAVATGYTAHLNHMGEFGLASGEMAFDNNLNTFWADISDGTTWIGLDLTTQVADVNCMYIALAGVTKLHPANAELQGWDGLNWATRALANSPWMATLIHTLPDVSMIGWQRRQSPSRSLWRIENTYRISSWGIKEVEFHSTVTCSEDPIQGNFISSAVTSSADVPDGGHALPQFAFDGNPLTEWAAQCPPMYKEWGALKGGCPAGTAWIGADADRPVSILCIRLMQADTKDQTVTEVILSSWANAGVEGALVTGWLQKQTFTGLGSDTWNTRPAGPDVLWRVVLLEMEANKCYGENRPAYKRSWGVAELKFFSDDGCTVQLPGPEPEKAGSSRRRVEIITSGSRSPAGVAGGGSNPFAPYKAFDGNKKSFWAAECNAGATSNRSTTDCVAGEEWIGLDFTKYSNGMPMEVRCIDIHQSRNLGAECCETASRLRLERWNGTTFVPAEWVHYPRDKAPVSVNGDFENLGTCPPLQAGTGLSDILAFTKWERRGRRQSANCKIPLSGAVQLLTNPLCEKHPVCKSAGYKGKCCPIDPASAAISRCCCNFLSRDGAQVFEDEIDIDASRKVQDTAPVIGMEYLMIRFTSVMPFVGAVFALAFYFLVLFPKRTKGDFGFRFYATFCHPIHHWMRPRDHAPVAMTVRFFTLRQPKEKGSSIWIKRLFGLCVAWYVSGCALWIIFSCILAEIAQMIMLSSSFLIRWVKSPYDPKVPAEKKRLHFVLGIPFSDDTNRLEVKGIGDLIQNIAKSFLVGLVYAVRSIVDVIILRFAAMGVGAVDINISVGDVLAQVPDFIPQVKIGPWIDRIYEVISYSARAFSEVFFNMFDGVPRCEGPVLIFTGMCLISITLLLIRWINYDYFGLFTVGKLTIAKTRPQFQKSTMTAVLVGTQAVMFTVMQMIMLLFARAVTLVNITPWQTQQEWNCPYEGEHLSIYIARVFLFFTVFLSCAVTILCADGHFLGQKFLTQDFSRKIEIELHTLEENVEPGNLPIRSRDWLCIIPTMFGIWMDGWNVRGFLIKERATKYATEMKYPEICPHCSEAHVPYFEVMRATSMQLSLCFQLIPFGAVFGKGIEYMNNPPLLYTGSSLKCFNVSENMRMAREGMPKKLPMGREGFKFQLALFIAACKDYLLPFLKRCISIATYVILIAFTFFVSQDNLQTMVRFLFQAVIALSMFKAAFEFALPIALTIALAIMLVITGRRKKKPKTHEGHRRLALAGHIIHGVTTGIVAATALRDREAYGLSLDRCIQIGSLAGIVQSFGVVVVCYKLEQSPGSRLLGSVLLALLSCVWSVLLGISITWKETFVRQLTVSGLMMLYLVPMSHVCFLPVRTIEGRGRGKIKPHELPSILSPLLHYPRAIPPPLGTVAGVFVSVLLADVAGFFQRKTFLDYWLLVLCALCGIFVGIALGFGADGQVGRRAGQYAVITAVCVSVAVGIIFPMFLAICAGALVGSIVGNAMETKEMNDLDKENFEQVSFKEPKVKHTGLLKPQDISGEAITLHASHEKYEAWGGSPRGHGDGADSVWRGAADPACLPAPQLLPSEPDADEDASNKGNADLDDSGSPKGDTSPLKKNDLAIGDVLKKSDDQKQLALQASIPQSMTRMRSGDSPSPAGRSVVASAPAGKPANRKKYTMQNAAKKTRRVEPPEQRATRSRPPEQDHDVASPTSGSLGASPASGSSRRARSQG
jgi:hypothetical protein